MNGMISPIPWKKGLKPRCLKPCPASTAGLRARKLELSIYSWEFHLQRVMLRIQGPAFQTVECKPRQKPHETPPCPHLHSSFRLSLWPFASLQRVPSCRCRVESTVLDYVVQYLLLLLPVGPPVWEPAAPSLARDTPGLSESGRCPCPCPP